MCDDYALPVGHYAHHRHHQAQTLPARHHSRSCRTRSRCLFYYSRYRMTQVAAGNHPSHVPRPAPREPVLLRPAAVEVPVRYGILRIGFVHEGRSTGQLRKSGNRVQRWRIRRDTKLFHWSSKTQVSCQT